MYAYIKGNLEEKNNQYVVIEAGGVGYKIFMSTASIEKVGELKQQVKVYTYYYVREDNISLYGFLTNEELKMFELLLSVSGIGAKTALVMLSKISPSRFALAIITGDVSELKKIPGVGPKSAQRMILELKDKLKTADAISEEEKIGQEITVPDDASQEAMAALQMLGYSRREIEQVFAKLSLKELSVEDIIRKALSILGK